MTIAFDHVGTVVTGYGLTALALAAYGVRLVLRGRSLARRVPREDQPWT